jgi:hypothetical protein
MCLIVAQIMVSLENEGTREGNNTPYWNGFYFG